MTQDDPAVPPVSGDWTQRVSADPINLLLAWQPGTSPDDSVAFAAWIARSANVKIRVVGTQLRPWPVTGLRKMAGTYQEWLEKQTQQYRKKVKAALQDADIDRKHWDRDYAVFLDGPSEAALLTEAAADFDAQLIVVGSTSAAPKGRFRAESTADALMHSSPRMLSLVPRSPKLSKSGITRVNVAFLENNYEQHEKVLRFGAKLAERFDVPLRILAFTPMGLTELKNDLKLEKARDINQEWHEYALGMLDRARDVAIHESENITVETTIGAGKGWAGAHGSVKWKKGDLLAMGSNPVGPIARVFVGSTAAEFLQHVQVPVIVSPAVAS